MGYRQSSAGVKVAAESVVYVSVLRESSFRGAEKYGMLSNDADNERDGIRRDSGALPRGACLGLVGLACITIRN